MTDRIERERSMKPCNQTCPKCGAFPVSLRFHMEVTEREAAMNRRLSESPMPLVAMLSVGIECAIRSVVSPAYIACSCPRCKHHWRVKPADAQKGDKPGAAAEVTP